MNSPKLFYFLKFLTTLSAYGGGGGNRTRKGRGVNPSKQAVFGLSTGGVDQDIDQPYRHRSSRADAHRRKMGSLSDELKKAVLRVVGSGD